MLDSDKLESIYNGLKSKDKADLLKACEEAGKLVSSMDPKEERVIADGLTSLLYIDTTRQPEFTEVIDCASDTLASMGPQTVDVLIEGLTDTDLQANVLIANTLGKIGKPAVAVLKERFRTEIDPYHRSMALFALSKIDDPALIDIFPEVVSTLDHENPELRDVAAQAIGRMVDCIGGACLTDPSVNEAFDKLMMKVSDHHPGTRSKAIRSIGKLAAAEYLGEEQIQRALDAVTSLLGIDGKHEWDRAFMVRKEAEEAYSHLTGRQPKSRGASEFCSD